MLLRRRSVSRRVRAAGLAFVALAGSSTVATGGGTAGSARPPFVNVWVPYWDDTAGLDSFGSAEDAAMFNEVSPFFLQAQGDGAVVTVGSSSRFARTVANAREKGLRVIPSITDGTGKLGMQRIMGDPTLRAQHIANIVTAIVGGGYDGIDLDYEVFAFTDGPATWPTTMPRWVQFVQELSVALHAQSKQLIVTIPPVWNAKTVGEQKDYWVYAQDQIAPFIDRLRLMVYDWSPSTPSATAPITWVQQVVAYSTKVAKVPVEKLQLGVPAYGRHWRRAAVTGATCPNGSTVTNSVTTADAPGLAAAKGVAIRRDTASGEMTFTWTETVTGVYTPPSAVVPPLFNPPVLRATSIAPAVSGERALRLGAPPSVVTCDIRHTVFFPDEWSIAQKAQVALDQGWNGIVMWAAGYEPDEVYDVLRTTFP